MAERVSVLAVLAGDLSSRTLVLFPASVLSDSQLRQPLLGSTGTCTHPHKPT